jgi:hypothetical protein
VIGSRWVTAYRLPLASVAKSQQLANGEKHERDLPPRHGAHNQKRFEPIDHGDG